MAGYVNFQVTRNKRKSFDLTERTNKNKSMDNLTKSERLMEGVGIWASYYRANPHRLVTEYLGLQLHLFQAILLYFMMHFNYFMYIAARGQGKTTLTAIFCVVKCILYPNTQVIIASGNKSQAAEVIEKIVAFRSDSPILQREISEAKTTVNDARAVFSNGSTIRIVASNDGARSKRANLVIIDEFRMVDKDIINMVLRKFKASPRTPPYLFKPEYKDVEELKESNQEIYLSSAWYKHHWSWDKFKSFFEMMAKGSKYFICGLPYQLSVASGLLPKEQIMDEMSENDFDPVAWEMEMSCMFIGETEKAYFKYNDLNDARKDLQPLYPDSLYENIRMKDKNFKKLKKKDGEIRILSCDIASAKGNANDNSAYSLLRLTPTKNGYDRTIAYLETWNGMRTDDQAIRIRQLYSDFEVDYIVLDMRNIGSAVYEHLTKQLQDKQRGVEYDALSCMNNEDYANICAYPDAKKVIYAVNGTEQFNSECHVRFLTGIRNGIIKLLSNEMEMKDMMPSRIKGYETLTDDDKMQLIAPFIQTSILVNEMVQLERVPKDNGAIKLVEPAGKRKDRYMSVAYGNYFARELEVDYLKSLQNDDNDDQWSGLFFTEGF